MTEFSAMMFPELIFMLLYMGYSICPQTSVFHFYSFKDAAESYIKTTVLEEMFGRSKDKVGGGSGVTFWLCNLLWDAPHVMNRENCHQTLKGHRKASGTGRSRQEHTLLIYRSKHETSYY